MNLEINITEVEGGHVAELTGSIQATNSDEVLKTLLPLALPSSRLILDGSRLQFISSAGLRLLLQLHRSVTAAQGRLILAALQPEVAEVMQITGFLPHFLNVESVEAALALDEAP